MVPSPLLSSILHPSSVAFLINRGENNPTNKTLVSFLGCDDRTVIRNLLILEEKGIIKMVYGGYLDDTRTVIRLTVA